MPGQCKENPAASAAAPESGSDAVPSNPSNKSLPKSSPKASSQTPHHLRRCLKLSLMPSNCSTEFPTRTPSLSPPSSTVSPLVERSLTEPHSNRQRLLRLESPLLATKLHSKIVMLDLESDDFERNDMINFHAECGDSSVATALFDAHCEVGSYCRVCEERLFHDTEGKDFLVSQKVMITGYVKRGEMDRREICLIS